MNFTEPIFLCCFPLFLLGHAFFKGKTQLSWLFICSGLFYAWYSPSYTLLLLLSIFVDYGLGILMEDQRSSKLWVTLSLVFNLSLLITFKYLGFFWNDALIPLCSTLGLALHPVEASLPPMGISFFTFQTMSYAIDVHRGQLKASRSPLQFACYVSLFPQLVAGPIVRATELLHQIKGMNTVTWENLQTGAFRFSRGFLKKSCLADPLALHLVDPVFLDPVSHSPEARVCAMLAYSFQIYFDFSGYSDMAIGCGRMMGYIFPENFKHPYRSASFSEFWTRWHISLSSWLRDYLYIPLGGNRKGPQRTAIHLLITMLLGGLWHGASALFLLWGGLHGLFLIAQRCWSSYTKTKLPKWLSVSLVFTLTTLTWVPFRAQHFDHIFMFWQSSFTFSITTFSSWLVNHLDHSFLLIFCVLSHFFSDVLCRTLNFKHWPIELKAVFYGSCAYWLLVFYPKTQLAQPFIYFQF